MKLKIKYLNNPHDVKVTQSRIAPIGKGLWEIYVLFNLRGMEIGCWMSYSDGKRSTLIDNGDESVIEIVYIAESDDEKSVTIIDRIYKDYYRAFVVANNKLEKGWKAYENKRSNSRKV